MAATLTDIIATAYATDGVGDTNTLEIIPGIEGSGTGPVLTRNIISENITAEAGQILSDTGWILVDVDPVGTTRQASRWTNAGDFYVASVVPSGTDTRCDACGQERWVATADNTVVCACALDA